jgi:uncharacterized heparinase superfamily protein
LVIRRGGGEGGGSILGDEGLRERMRWAALTSVRAARVLAKRASAPYHLIRALAIVPPTRLRIAPPDIRTVDSTVADEIYHGCFSFEGKTVYAQAVSPFEMAWPSAPWRRALAGFSWLRHLRSEEGSHARDHGRAHVAAFLAIRKPIPDDPAFEPAVRARRVLSFLSQSPLLLDDADAEFYERFMSGLAADVRALSQSLGAATLTADERLLCVLAFAEYCICADAAAAIQPRATRLLGQELDRQITSDGGHIGRNPQTLLDLLLDLLPVRRIYGAWGRSAPQAVMGAIDRIIPMLRMLQHGDGSLALFNGMGATSLDLLASVLSHEDSPGSALASAPYAGYQRLEGGEALVIVDAGPPPPLEFSQSAHAGCLAFEYSIGFDQVIVNCGAPPLRYTAARQTARATAAHSTLVLNDRSSCRFAVGEGLEKWLDGRIVAGPREVRVERRHASSGDVLELSHNGYVADYGMLHERVLALTHDGARFIGEDRLLAGKPGQDLQPCDFVIRFHIHPRVAVAPTADGKKIELLLPSGERLLFSARGVIPAIEESIFFAAAQGPCRSLQIVLAGSATAETRVRWAFRRGSLVSPAGDS